MDFISYRRSLIINSRMDGIQYYNIRMFKKTVFFLLCTVLILSQNLRGNGEHLIGGYQPVNPKFKGTAEEMKDLADIEKFARTEIGKANTGEVLGELIDYKRQLVAGFNHKLTFETEKGTIEIVIFDQPWTNTRKVTSIDNKGNNELIE